MNKLLLKSVREYKKQSILTPIFVLLEVLLEVMIPMEMAKIIDIGIAGGNLPYIIQRGFILVVMAMLALYFGVTAGKTAAIAAAGYAKNLRHDIFYRVQEFSFKNIDHFSTSGLVTRMTTDITNVQMAYMMSLRLLARAPHHGSFIMGYDSDHQSKDCAFIFSCDPRSGRRRFLLRRRPIPIL